MDNLYGLLRGLKSDVLLSTNIPIVDQVVCLGQNHPNSTLDLLDSIVVRFDEPWFHYTVYMCHRMRTCASVESESARVILVV
jgi:hypothetical protein